MLPKTLESPLNNKEIKQINLNHIMWEELVTLKYMSLP